MLLIDKYNIKNKEDIIFHEEIYDKLLNNNYNDLPNLLIHGPPGSGKHTLINLLLQDIYGKEINNIRNEIYEINEYGNNTKEICIKQSNNHIVIEPNNNGLDKYIIQEIVNEYAKRYNISKIPYKIIFINNVDNLSYYAQTSLRCTMEKYYKTCKFILCSYQLSKIIEPLRSRCLNIRIPNPSNLILLKIILNIVFKENININLEQCFTIIKKSKGNIKICIWMLELIKNKIYDLDLLWKDLLNQIVDIINYCSDKKITLQYINDIRNVFNTILISNISGTEIMIELMEKLINYNYDNELKNKIIKSFAKYEYRLAKGKRNIIHLEGLIIHIIYIINEHKNKSIIK
jgi:replication factor C subunit 3/5